MLHNKISSAALALRWIDLEAPDARARLDMVALNLDALAEGVECMEAHFVPADKETPHAPAAE